MTEAAGKTTIDDAQVEWFSKMAAEWWDPRGKFKPLHKFNPVRISYIREKACAHFGRDVKSARPLEGLRVLDVGCGGGLLSEPMARMGASVVGIDPAEKNIGIANTHAAESGVPVDYRAVTAEQLAEDGESFDIVLNMEVVEHVADVDFFMTTCASLVKPGGMMFVATINRTLKAGALAIFAAERVLRWLPPGTHQYEKLVRPEEIETPLKASGVTPVERQGVFYSPLTDSWNRSKDTDVNYMVLAVKPEA
ncbi:MAG: bifunctional 3-demethylubiquinol 3-O-methyltransferase/2-polyprenyl-6-hydroxyphenol methylase [Martelella sp.]|uniref:bifunctional 2-polyprenyl-6-hydroxyphenol methylase/3-demethylubiquinol 3-O-methyltransferase UbiG n=1 Tax=unclassified Martelella TaxID=2629616 RepID=UPI000C396BF8|nr:bifunctional 2-polyprenyl-6-hydroxyphenol methylase/3-demethylubiquinol 3-O-methyltransferase UbiG [Martelella sp.]MAU20069.1 bifunctional 3-demethylubiquinol 3-O-methyltransferase/2-polyprenyl-6-hydroxyphenol methylase [Martelella sp.]|tara:strand:- start:824 stop:1576 length:753 start_codon:yes stop_codon:yes gene_type:complete